MNIDKNQKMRCPKCKLHALKERQDKIICSACGYALSAGEAAKFRLFKLLENEGGGKK